MKNRTLKVIKISTVFLLLGCAYAVFTEHFGFGIPCLFNLVTELRCPGCGVSRMCLSLMCLDFKSAFNYNPAIFCLLPFFLYLLTKTVYRYIKYGTQKLTKTDNILTTITIVILLAFGVVRNFQ